MNKTIWIPVVAVVVVVVGILVSIYVLEQNRLPEPPVPVDTTEMSNLTKASDPDAYFEKIRGDFDQLIDFFGKMPKGGDLHNHLSGSVNTDDLIQIAIDKKKCIFLNNMTIARNQTAPNCVTAVPVTDNATLRDEIEQSWSMFKFNDTSIDEGHEHFFATFGKFSALSEFQSSELGYWKIVAEQQNMQYLETMLNEGYERSQISNLTEKIIDIDLDKFGTMYDTLLPDVKEIAKISSDNIGNLEDDSQKFCISKNYTCEIPFNYIYQVHRTKYPHNVFAQMMTGFEISNQSSLVVGIDMVAAEDNYISMKYYEMHMQMLNFLSEIYDDVNITLHAGELSTALSNVTASNMTNHIVLAINTGNAQRIGHGVDITYEINTWPDLYQNMSRNMITVEVPLTSNRIILKVEGQDHPIINYTKYGVPVSLATDDPGILNTNMTNEYSIAASNYTSLNYSDFKKIARNSLEFSFLSGMSLWENPDYSSFVSECKGIEVGFVDITSTCAKFLENNKKATVQWEFETKLKEFEDNLPN